jgi:hypothetical protein
MAKNGIASNKIAAAMAEKTLKVANASILISLLLVKYSLQGSHILLHDRQKIP